MLGRPILQLARLARADRHRVAVLQESGREGLADHAGADDADLHAFLLRLLGQSRPASADVGRGARADKAR